MQKRWGWFIWKDSQIPCGFWRFRPGDGACGFVQVILNKAVGCLGYFWDAGRGKELVMQGGFLDRTSICRFGGEVETDVSMVMHNAIGWSLHGCVKLLINTVKHVDQPRLPEV